MRTYIQLTQEQRCQIKALLKIDQNQTQIAKGVGVNKSTISRELRRNCGQRGYRPKQAHQIAMSRKKKNKLRIVPETWTLIEEKLRCQKKRRNRYGSYDRRGKIPNKKSIEERPEVVERPRTPGRLGNGYDHRQRPSWGRGDPNRPQITLHLTGPG